MHERNDPFELSPVYIAGMYQQPGDVAANFAAKWEIRDKCTGL